ncbi:MAG: ribbon-helix-helix domain-containing protein [Verrucomicrobia bacterium]|nr:ribbon-helix-helix domain-containing protein [Verrucomicrobiota bacterium]MDA1066000.1 ribbon-helix-helix domain-containing protein [Verrucomicrobiota bacterium]
MNKTTILLPDDLQKRARSLAKKNGTTLSGLIRKQLEQAVTEDGGATQIRSEDPLFSNWKPSDADIPSDMSVNHDRYLYGE